MSQWVSKWTRLLVFNSESFPSHDSDPSSHSSFLVETVFKRSSRRYSTVLLGGVQSFFKAVSNRSH